MWNVIKNHADTAERTEHLQRPEEKGDGKERYSQDLTLCNLKVIGEAANTETVAILPIIWQKTIDKQSTFSILMKLDITGDDCHHVDLF